MLYCVPADLIDPGTFCPPDGGNCTFDGTVMVPSETQDAYSVRCNLELAACIGRQVSTATINTKMESMDLYHEPKDILRALTFKRETERVQNRPIALEEVQVKGHPRTALEEVQVKGRPRTADTKRRQPSKLNPAYKGSDVRQSFRNISKKDQEFMDDGARVDFYDVLHTDDDEEDDSEEDHRLEDQFLSWISNYDANDPTEHTAMAAFSVTGGTFKIYRISIDLPAGTPAHVWTILHELTSYTYPCDLFGCESDYPKERRNILCTLFKAFLEHYNNPENPPESTEPYCAKVGLAHSMQGYNECNGNAVGWEEVGYQIAAVWDSLFEYFVEVELPDVSLQMLWVPKKFVETMEEQAYSV
ncbi:hypothetical protein FPQ18DRAFT_308487 [Pyronema domesticum]|nr:hypothetical protein FPQ18DRAFT_308487 [Pyronema domesticum]